MQAGRLRHRIQLQRATELKDDSGGVVRTWTTITPRWGDILPARGSERFDAAKTEAQTNVKIRIRNHGTIDPTWRIKFGDKIYNINSVVNVGERNFMTEIDCIEVLKEDG